MRKNLINWYQENDEEMLLGQYNNDRVVKFETENKPDTFWAKTFLVVAVFLTGFFWLWLFPTVFGN